jgi:hypothetical protein
VTRAGFYNLETTFSGAYNATKVVYDVVAAPGALSIPASFLQLPSSAVTGHISLVMRPRDRFGNSLLAPGAVLSAFVAGPSPAVVPTEDWTWTQGEYRATVLLTVAGAYVFTLRGAGGEEGAERGLVVRPGATDPQRVVVSGATGPFRADVAANVTVVAYDRFGNRKTTDFDEFQVQYHTANGETGPSDPMMARTGAGGVYASVFTPRKAAVRATTLTIHLGLTLVFRNDKITTTPGLVGFQP